jgi:hypothetical protein
MFCGNILPPTSVSKSRQKKPAEAGSKQSLEFVSVGLYRAAGSFETVIHIFKLPDVTIQKTLLFVVIAMRMSNGTWNMYTFGYKSKRHELTSTCCKIKLW